jgi:rhodanese-related sulfurtransferase
MFSKQNFMWIGLWAWIFPSCAAGQVQNSAYNAMLGTLLAHSVAEISVDALQKDKQTPPLLLDARTPKEYNISHLKNGIYVGYDDFDLKNIPKNTPKNQPIVVYCSVGYRSEKVCEKLQKAGFTDVKNLYGGIFEWKNAGGKVYDTQGETDRIHAYNRTWGVWLRKGKKVY